MIDVAICEAALAVVGIQTITLLGPQVCEVTTVEVELAVSVKSPVAFVRPCINC